MVDEAATIEGQFRDFSRLLDNKRNGTTMTLYRADYWLRQCKILDDRKITMVDTGLLWWKWSKTELNFDEWYEFISDLCNLKGLVLENVIEMMTNCGQPGSVAVTVPAFRQFFDTYKPKEKLMINLD